MYVDKNININERFLEVSEKIYHTQTESMDTQKKTETAKKINDWVAKQTHGHIKELVNAETVSNSVILMLNALYFQGAWRKGFMKNETITDDFYVSKDKTVKTEFIRQKGQFMYGVSKTLNAKILRMPYKGYRFAMFIIIPNAVDGINDLSNKLQANTLKMEVELLNSEDVQI